MTRRILIVLVVMLASANAIYLFAFSHKDSSTFEAEWIGFMPELEAYQLTDIYNVLMSPHGHGPRYPELYSWEIGNTYPKFSRWAAECGVSSYLIDKYVHIGKEGAPLEMPDRFYTKKLNGSQVSCLRKLLPSGYSLKRLKEPTHPSEILWDASVHNHLANGKNNAQAH